MASGVLAPSQRLAAVPDVPHVPATWYVVKGSNDTYWRVDVPAKAVGANVCKVPFATGKRQFSEPGVGRDREFRWFETEDGASYPDHEGTAVFTRADQARLTHALAMAANGTRVVAEVDDNYLAPLQQNDHLRAAWDEQARLSHLDTFAGFDAVVFATEWLRDEYARAMKWRVRSLYAQDKQKDKSKARRRVACAEYHVCGNHVDPDAWPERVERDGRLRVGWMGGPSHRLDLPLAYPALKWAADAGHEVVIVGMDPVWWPQTKLQFKQGRYSPHPNHDNPLGFAYTHIPWVDPADFERTGWPLDVALAPLRNDRFCLGKSDVKFLEYGMSGAATVASNIPVYNRSVRHGETGFLAGGREEMLHWTQELCANTRLREEIVRSAQQYIREERLVTQHAHEWREAIGG